MLWKHVLDPSEPIDGIDGIDGFSPVPGPELFFGLYSKRPGARKEPSIPSINRFFGIEKRLLHLVDAYVSLSSWPGLVGPGAGCGGGAGLGIAGSSAGAEHDTSGRASGGGSGLGVSTPLAAQDGTVTAKLRPKEDSDCRSFWSSASAQIRSRQEGEDKLEPAFKVQSREAIHTVSCRVDGRWRSNRVRS